MLLLVLLVGAVKALPVNYLVSDNFPSCVRPPENTLHLRNEPPICAASWAQAAANTLSDRFCVEGLKVQFSAQYIMCSQNVTDCCETWRDQSILEDVVADLQTNGAVLDRCVPFSGNCSCSRSQCDEDSKANFSLFRIHQVQSNLSTEALKRELFEHGSVLTAILVPPPLTRYTSGVFVLEEPVYKNQTVSVAARIVGYGIEVRGYPIPFWTLLMPWGRSFGENGTIRLLRGSNLLGVEENAVAFLPQLPPACPLGKEFDPYSDECVKCEPGRAKDVFDFLPCSLCKAGEYAPSFGSISCSACIHSKWCKTHENLTCSCPTGSQDPLGVNVTVIATIITAIVIIVGSCCSCYFYYFSKVSRW